MKVFYSREESKWEDRLSQKPSGFSGFLPKERKEGPMVVARACGQERRKIGEDRMEGHIQKAQAGGSGDKQVLEAVMGTVIRWSHQKWDHNCY